MDRVLKIIIDAMCIILIVLLVAYAILRFTNKIEIYKVETGSMEDGIHVGDYILVSKEGEYRVGDIVTFKKYGNFVTHRIVEKNGDRVVTKGDANNIEDDEISVNDIVGKVVFKGGLLNIIIDYKFVIVSFLLSFYLLTYYFSSKEKKEEENEVLE